ncbi:DUF2591 family protein [Cronobacter dublinensis]
MDYSQLSDFEINKRVAICIHPEIRDWNCYDVSGRACFVINENTRKRVQFGFSFTTNPADAWPIMTENKISVMWMTAEKQWCAWANGNLEEGCWEWSYCPDEYHHDDNPLRAAMIVFLMMKESLHA